MLLSETVKIKWTLRNKKKYQELGYSYTKVGDEFDIKIEHLSPYSKARINLMCDYCGRSYSTNYESWIKHTQQGIIKKDCCKNSACTTQKAQEALLIKYGVKYSCDVPFAREKAKQTNLKKYGCENPFANKEIQEKIKKTNLKRYNCTVPMKNPDIRAKAEKTCLERYGVINYGALYGSTHKGELAPAWKGDARKTDHMERYNQEYREFRLSVYTRDNYTCQCCGAKNQKGQNKSVYLEAHHLNNFKDYVDERYDSNNGVTLCQECHRKFHSMYGFRHTTKEQYYNFLEKTKKEIDKKIC